MERKLSEEDLKTMRDLNRKGWTDKEIADELRVTQACIIYQRRKAGLKSNYIPRGVFLRLWEKGFSIAEIAEKLNKTANAVIHTAEKHELDTNGAVITDSGSLPGRIELLRNEGIAKKLKEGWMCSRIAKEYGIPLNEVNAISDGLFQSGVLAGQERR